MSKTVSVIIPMYNAERFIKDCVASALGQTIPFEEIIIVDDGSSDRSLDICRDYMQKNKSVKLYTQPNGGAAAARNTGLKHVTSEYVVFWMRMTCLQIMHVK